MTERGSVRRWRRSSAFAALIVAAGLVVALVVAACEIPTHAGDFATEPPDATTVTTTQCGSGQTFCSADDDAGVCTDTQSDIDNCGACGNACDPTLVCSFGVCACPSTQHLCGGKCVDLTQDTQNCGACDAGCGVDQVCITNTATQQKSVCLAFCLEGETNCPAGCFNLQNEARHCGGCEKACDAGDSCQSGTCTLGCGKGQTICDDGCATLSTDLANCGMCGNACLGSNSRCIASACTCPGANEVVCGSGNLATCTAQTDLQCGPSCQSCRPSVGTGLKGPLDAAVPGICSARGTCIYDAGPGYVLGGPP